MQDSSEQGGGASEDHGLVLPGAAPFQSTALGGQNSGVNPAFPGLAKDICQNASPARLLFKWG